MLGGAASGDDNVWIDVESSARAANRATVHVGSVRPWMDRAHETSKPSRSVRLQWVIRPKSGSLTTLGGDSGTEGPPGSTREASTTVASMLETGSTAPAFTLPDQDGNPVRLSSLKGRRVLVYFYPKADTPGCTQQSCLLRDVVDRVGDTAIIGISPDTPAKQKKFADKYDLPFPLLADVEHVVAEKYGVWKQKSMYGRTYMGIERSAFLIGANGKIEHAWYKVSPKDTPANLLQALKG